MKAKATVIASETYTIPSESCLKAAAADLEIEDPEKERALAAIRDGIVPRKPTSE
jgi:hypothetical protein